MRRNGVGADEIALDRDIGFDRVGVRGIAAGVRND